MSFDLDPFFLFEEPRENPCVAESNRDAPSEYEKIFCPAVPGHRRGGERISDLEVIIPCDPIPSVIFTWISECLVQDTALQVLRDEGLTGFSTRPAKARLKDSYAMVSVSELVVTGWGGVAPEASGIREVDRCVACGQRHYSAIEEPRELVDIKSWDGSDFFMIWPLPRYRFVTSRVAAICAKYKISGVSLERDFPITAGGDGFSPGRLSYYMPSERAHALGDPLDIS